MEISKIKLSIVIPYYQCYEYTKKLLDILVPQLTEETEVVLVDDGCNEKRLDEYKNKIRIYHLKENQGGGHACNVGIEKAKGKYVGFIDADDYVSDDYIKTLLWGINDNPTDLIYLDWQDTYTGEIVRRPDNYAPWKAIYKKEIMPRFCESHKYHFDVAFYDELKKKGFNRSYVDKLLYFYNSKRPDNLSDRDNREKKNKSMRYVILAYSNDNKLGIPRQLVEINGEPLLKRTIRLLKQNGVENILLLAKDERFDNLGVTKYTPQKHTYDYKTNTGYWLDAFPFELMNEPICFIWGDVYFSEQAIKTIVETTTNSTLFFCTYENKNPKYIKEYDEPLAYKVVDTDLFKTHINIVKTLYDEGKTIRNPIVWEVYRSINGIDVNEHRMTENYIAINDESCDIDYPEELELLRSKIENV